MHNTIDLNCLADFQQVIAITQKRLIENYLRKLKGSGKYFEVKEET
jgi:hypothetical protein